MNSMKCLFAAVIILMSGCTTPYYPENMPTYFSIPLKQAGKIQVNILDFRPLLMNEKGLQSPGSNLFALMNAYGGAPGSNVPFGLNPLGPMTFLNSGVAAILESSIAHNKIDATVHQPVMMFRNKPNKAISPLESSLLLADGEKDVTVWNANQVSAERIDTQIQLTAFSSNPEAKIGMAIVINDFLYQYWMGFASEAQRQSNGFHYDVDVVIVDSNKKLLSRRAFRGLVVPTAEFMKKAQPADIFFFCTDTLLKRIFTDAGVLAALSGTVDPTPYELLSIEDKNRRLEELLRIGVLDKNLAKRVIAK